jgi:hypothetical protein
MSFNPLEEIKSSIPQDLNFENIACYQCGSDESENSWRR